jgi:CDP-paratose 2-epimerase
MNCAITGEKYTVLGYKGKQVRDNIHSWDLVNMFWHFFLNPRHGEVYNAGGGRHSNCSMAEAILKCEEITGKPMNFVYSEINRIGDHIWWISDVSKFKAHYPDWHWKYNINDILIQIYESTLNKIQ